MKTLKIIDKLIKYFDTFHDDNILPIQTIRVIILLLRYIYHMLKTFFHISASNGDLWITSIHFFAVFAVYLLIYLMYL